jgi:pSer/pThr/pTyr-binding forkhead associated (FHA) protein
MRLVLEVTSGPHQGERLEISSGQTVRVGRTRKAELALADNFLSGVHFAVECDAKGCRARDLNSRNGTKVNGNLIVEAALKNGDHIFAGKTNFTVRIEPLEPKPAAEKPASRERAKSVSRRKISKKLTRAKTRGSSGGLEPLPPPVFQTEIEEPKPIKISPPADRPAVPLAPDKAEPSAPHKDDLPVAALDSYEAATPDGRLLQILSSQPQALMALVDAVHDPSVLELLRTHGEEHQSLYSSVPNPSIAPFLLRLPPRSPLLKQMIQKGWGRGWGVYLTCQLSVPDLREYFRKALMVTMPDGMELFSRFYDPRFFRGFLESCSAPEGERFFGPVTSYFMEDERPEILLQFTNTKTGVEKKGHLLSSLP